MDLLGVLLVLVTGFALGFLYRDQEGPDGDDPETIPE